jgi:Fic family protein
MPWNWQQPDWPRFTWNASRLAKAEDRFLVGSGVYFGATSHLPEADADRLAVEAITTEAMTTSAIEGEILNRDSVQSSVQRQLGLATPPPSRARIRPGEEGIAEMTVDVYRRPLAPLEDRTLFAWHTMVCRGRADLGTIGGYRTHSEPMRVVSAGKDGPRVHFEAPPSAAIPEEMRRFIDWFNDTGPAGAHALPALARAGIVHIYFESIHPFEDGNGRIGRALSEKALAQNLGRPTLTALAATILRRRPEYYRELEVANKNNEITRWLAWFAGIILEAQRRTTLDVEFLIRKARLLDAARARHNERQIKVLLRILREGVDGFSGGLSASNYAAIAGTPPATTTRDLRDMVEAGTLARTGENKGVRYHLPFSVGPVPRFVVAETGEVKELTDRRD